MTSHLAQLAENLHLVDKSPKKDEDIFGKITKTAVIQEAKCVNDKQLNEKKCRNVLKNLIFLFNQGQKFNETETTEIFFSITKLFQSQNLDLRRMIYRIVREIQHETSFFVITSCLVKDLGAKVDLFKMNALRLLPLVIDSQNIVQSERFIRSAIIDKSTAISSAALLTAFNVLPKNAELVRKWVGEITEKANSRSPAQIQHHALLVLHEMKKNDKMSFIKNITALTKEKLSPVATVQLIRFIKEALLTLELESSVETSLIEFLTKQLKNNSDAVIFEAARAMCSLKYIPNKELATTISTLSLFVLSSSSINKYAALKILNKLINNPVRAGLITYTQDLESLITDPNKGISSLAISILLKVCKESNIDSLVVLIHENFNDIAEEFKAEIILSMKTLVKKSASKWRIPMQFVALILRSTEGSEEIKRACIEVFIYIIRENPDSRETAVLHLCDFTEDCLHKSLLTPILSFLTEEIPRTEVSARCLRYLINRLFLEEGDIRAAAVSLVGNVAIVREELREELLKLLKICMDDLDDEVRARASFFLGLLSPGIEITPVDTKLLMNGLPLSTFDQIENYIVNNMVNVDAPDFFSAEKIFSFQGKKNTKKMSEDDKIEVLHEEASPEEAGGLEVVKVNENIEEKRKEFAQHEGYEEFGDLLHMHTGIAVTDEGAEATVHLNKYFFESGFIVLEFSIENHIENAKMKEATVDLKIENQEVLQVASIAAVHEIGPNQKGLVQVALAKNPQFKLVTVKDMEAFLKFTVVQIGSEGEEEHDYLDEIQLENVKQSHFSEHGLIPLIVWWRNSVV